MFSPNHAIPLKGAVDTIEELVFEGNMLEVARAV
jgi:hypothetical protein